MDYEYYVMGSLSYKKLFRFLKYYRVIRSVPVPCCLFYRSAVYMVTGRKLQGVPTVPEHSCPALWTRPPPARLLPTDYLPLQASPRNVFLSCFSEIFVGTIFSVQENQIFWFPCKNLWYRKNINYLPLYLWRVVDKWLGHLPVGVWSSEFKFGHGTFMGMGSSR